MGAVGSGGRDRVERRGRILVVVFGLDPVHCARDVGEPQFVDEAFIWARRAGDGRTDSHVHRTRRSPLDVRPGRAVLHPVDVNQR